MKTGREVLVDIVEYFDEESVALELEKRLIEEIGQKSKGKGPLLNILSSGAPHYALAAAQESDGTENEDLDALAEPCVQELEKLGWHVVVESSGISLHDYFKNGKIKKAPTVYIQKFDDCSVRPWYCSAPSLKRAKSHAKVKNAVKFLLEMGRLHAPAK